MKKILFVALAVLGVSACNSGPEFKGGGGKFRGGGKNVFPGKYAA